MAFAASQRLLAAGQMWHRQVGQVVMVVNGDAVEMASKGIQATIRATMIARRCRQRRHDAAAAPLHA